jgi:hypothetical protein
MNKETAVVPVEVIERRIFLIRGQKVMLDRDLADLYGVATKVLTRRFAETSIDSRAISCSV